MMPSEILETFEYEGRIIHVHLEEDASDQDWLTVRAYYADGTLVNPFVYSVYRIKSGYRGLMQAKKTL
ncbi:hypothetical protein [Candidatus Glomeribacter gigasporarum]|nr:hypothetical protein [Candidatus Glomeribacter gigasporarum]